MMSWVNAVIGSQTYTENKTLSSANASHIFFPHLLNKHENLLLSNHSENEKKDKGSIKFPLPF